MLLCGINAADVSDTLLYARNQLQIVSKALTGCGASVRANWITFTGMTTDDRFRDDLQVVVFAIAIFIRKYVLPGVKTRALNGSYRKKDHSYLLYISHLSSHRIFENVLFNQYGKYK